LTQRRVGSIDHLIRLHAMVAQDQYGEWFRPMRSLGFDNGAGLYLWLAVQDEFNVFRVDVHTRRSDNDFFLAPPKVKVAFLVHRTDVAGVKPAIIRGSCRLFIAP